MSPSLRSGYCRILRRCGIASRNRGQNRLQRFSCWLLQLWPILVSAARIRYRLLLFERQAGHDAPDFDTVERFALEQALSQTHHHITILFNDVPRALVLCSNDLFYLLIDPNRRLLGEVAVLSDLTSEEDLLLLLAEREWSHL